MEPKEFFQRFRELLKQVPEHGRLEVAWELLDAASELYGLAGLDEAMKAVDQIKCRVPIPD